MTFILKYMPIPRFGILKHQIIIFKDVTAISSVEIWHMTRWLITVRNMNKSNDLSQLYDYKHTKFVKSLLWLITVRNINVTFKKNITIISQIGHRAK